MTHEWVEDERMCHKQMSAGLIATGEMRDEVEIRLYRAQCKYINLEFTQIYSKVNAMFILGFAGESQKKVQEEGKYRWLMCLVIIWPVSLVT